MVPRPLTERHSPPGSRLTFFALVLALLLAGCVSQTTSLPPIRAENFTVMGKLSVRGTDNPVSARFRWEQLGADFVVELWGPFGQGRRRLAGSDGMVDIMDGTGSVLTRGPAAEVMRSNFGFELPLESLRFWIQGRPDPRLAVLPVAADPGTEPTRRFRQAEWLIELLDEDPEGRPRRLRASGRGYEVRLALTRWLEAETV